MERPLFRPHRIFWPHRSSTYVDAARHISTTTTTTTTIASSAKTAEPIEMRGPKEACVTLRAH